MEQSKEEKEIAMAQKNLKKQFTKVVLGNFLVLFVIGGAIVYPAARHIINLQKDIENYQADLENRYKKARHLRKSLQELDNVREMTFKYANTKFSLEEGLEFKQKIDRMAVQYDIEQNITVSTHENKAHPLVDTNISDFFFIFSFHNHGPLENQIAFLRALEIMNEFMIIDRVSFQQRGDENNDVTMRFDGIVYAETISKN